jgi:hypothetical protein
MFVIDSDLTIHITRGDAALISVSANKGGANYEFKPDDVVRFKVFAKKNCADVVLKKDTVVTETADKVRVALNGEDTKIGNDINKPVDYWYEVELNPDTNPQTIIGYDENGAKIFKLYPEGGVANE